MSDAINQHKKMAMGEKIKMKKGGPVKAPMPAPAAPVPCMKKGGKVKGK